MEGVKVDFAPSTQKVDEVSHPQTSLTPSSSLPREVKKQVKFFPGFKDKRIKYSSKNKSILHSNKKHRDVRLKIFSIPLIYEIKIIPG